MSGIPWTPITDIKPGWFVHRWGDWLEVTNVEASAYEIILTVLDDDGPNTTKREKQWKYRRASLSGRITELIATPCPEQYK